MQHNYVIKMVPKKQLDFYMLHIFSLFCKHKRNTVSFLFFIIFSYFLQAVLIWCFFFFVLYFAYDIFLFYNTF